MAYPESDIQAAVSKALELVGYSALTSEQYEAVSHDQLGG